MHATKMPLQPAQNQLGRYQLVAPLGQGGMGTIHLAVAGGLADFHKLLVVKELRQDLAENRRFVEMFLDEAKLAARLNHPNVVQTIEAGQDGDRYFLSMEFLDGQPLSNIWMRAEQAPQVTLTMRLKILCDALAGLHYAHELTAYDGTKLHIVHRDVSPQNIFVTYDGQVKVVDFGIAKVSSSANLTAPGVFKGKLGYAAPEQVRGQDVDPRTDVFSMGVILWETLAMRPFASGTVSRENVAQRLQGQEPRAASLKLGTHPRLAELCDRALAVDPDERFESAQAFRMELEDFIATHGERLPTSALRDVMQAKFESERAVIHRLVDRHIKHGPQQVSQVSEKLLGSELGNERPTTVADLTKLVSGTHSSMTDESVTARPRAPHTKRLWWMVGIGTLVAASALAAARPWSWLGAHAAAPAEAEKPQGPLPGPGVTPSPSGASDAPSDTAGTAHAATPDTAPARPSTAGAATSQPRSAQPSLASDRAPGSVPAPTRRSARSRPSPEPTSPPPAAATERQVVSVTPAPERSEPPAPQTSNEINVGADLNRTGRGEQRRALDTSF